MIYEPEVLLKIRAYSLPAESVGQEPGKNEKEVPSPGAKNSDTGILLASFSSEQRSDPVGTPPEAVWRASFIVLLPVFPGFWASQTSALARACEVVGVHVWAKRN